MRVLEAVLCALETGETQTLPPLHRAKHPSPDQAIELPAITPPPLVNAHEPDEG